MELEKLNEIRLADGKKYKGWGYFKNQEFIPYGCGKKYFNGYYVYGNFHNGILNGPAIVSHNYYMYTMHFKKNRGNGWGMCINGGELIEFGYYENTQLKVNIADFVLWYFQKLQDADRDENMLNMYTYNTSHEVADLLIGYKGTPMSNGIRRCFMGFHFISDGSVWVGNTATRRYSGYLIHFCANGTIECGLFKDGSLIEPMDLQEVIDEYYGTYSYAQGKISEDLLKLFKPNHNPVREQFRNIAPIKPHFNYFSDKPSK